MKATYRSALALSFTLLSTGVAVASSETTLSVSATIIPAACTIALDNGGRFDFGNTYASSINRNGMSLLTPIETQLRVDCDQPTPVALLLTSLDVGSQVLLPLPAYGGISTPSPAFQGGLGYKNGNKIGSFQAEVKPNSFTDGALPKTVLVSGLTGDAWSPAATLRFGTDRLLSFGSSTSPQPVTDLVGTMRINVGIAHDQGLTFEDVIDFESNAVIELVYL